MPYTPEQRTAWRKARRKTCPFPYVLRNAKQRASKYGLEFSLTVEDVQEAWPKDNKCPVLGVRLDSGGIMASASVDRIDNDVGYVKGNIQIISHRANTMKSSSSPDELIKFALWVLTTYKGGV